VPKNDLQSMRLQSKVMTMKANTTDLLKFKKLQKRLGESVRGIVGLLEMLWIATAKNCPCGDIGKFTNDEIALLVDWDGCPDVLVEALVECKWVDLCGENRLVIHDWADHCPNYVKGNLSKHNREFISPKQPASEPPKQPASEPPKQPASEPPCDSATKSSQVKSSQAKPDQVKKNTKKKSIDIPSDEFLKWYAEYPRKVARDAAIPAYEMAIRKIMAEEQTDREDAIEALLEWTQERKPILEKMETQFIPHPATWLNRGGYRDSTGVQQIPDFDNDPVWIERNAKAARER